MPTKRKQNTPRKTPGKVAHPSRNSRTTHSTRTAASFRSSRNAASSSGSSSARSSAKRPSAQVAGASSRTHSRSQRGFSASTKPSAQSSSHSFLPNFNIQGGANKQSFNASGVNQSRPSSSTSQTAPSLLLTRRNLLIGAGILGGVAVLGGGASYALSAMGESDESVVSDYLTVPTDSVESLKDDFESLDAYGDYVSLSNSVKLDYGTLVWADNDTVAACLVPTNEASPLSTVKLLYLSSGNTQTILEEAQGASERYEILDVRCSTEGLIWVESNIFESSWRVYTAKLSSDSVSKITKVDEGNANWEIPSLAAVDKTAFWQVIPTSDGKKAESPSVVRAASFGSDSYREICSSKTAFATRITPAAEGIVVTPRVDAKKVYYQLTLISAKDYSVLDQLTLPSSMSPDTVGYGRSGFSFGFANIYSYGDGIANLGTYTPQSEASPYHYDDLTWFRFSKSPTASPCWCGEWYVAKSTSSICGVHFPSKQYFAIDTPSGCDSYGEYLVSTGTSSSIVGLSQITTDNDDENYALVRIYKPVEDAVGGAFES